MCAECVFSMSSLFASHLTTTAAPANRYRALNPLAIASVVLGALSIVTVLHWGLAIVPMAGIIVGWVAWKQIRKAPEEWLGATLVKIGVGLCVAMWLLGYGWLIFARAGEIPYGYDPVSYTMLQPDPTKPTEPIPQTAIDMNDRKVFLRGYMQSRRTSTGIKEFILCPTNADCPFCAPSPRPTEKVRVILQGDLETTYTAHEIAVAGRFRVNRTDAGGIPADGIPYELDADYLH
jgi:hypothetical protein